jgi:cold shock protein
MSTGTVKFFNETTGYGFIIDDETQDEIFVHSKGLKGISIRQNEKVSFKIVEGKRGLNAINVEKL